MSHSQPLSHICVSNCAFCTQKLWLKRSENRFLKQGMDLAHVASFTLFHSYPFIHGILHGIIRYIVENLALFTQDIPDLPKWHDTVALVRWKVFILLRDTHTMVISIDEMSKYLGVSVVTYRQVIALGSSEVVSRRHRRMQIWLMQMLHFTPCGEVDTHTKKQTNKQKHLAISVRNKVQL